MPNHINFEKVLFNKIKGLFIDPISIKPLKSTILWGQHTFSTETLNDLTIYHDYDIGYDYIKHPYTREVFYINLSEELPENVIINDLLLVFSYCRTIQLNQQTLRNIMIYFVKSLVKQQKKINNTEHLLDQKNEITDFLLKDLLELLDYKEEVIKILSNVHAKKLVKPLTIHLNGILFMAIKHNNERLTALLLSKKFRINVAQIDCHEKNLLFWACYHGHAELAEQLLNLNVNPNAEDLQTRTTPLFWACHYNQFGLAEKLVQAGASVNHKNTKGQTPLFLACTNSQHSIAQMLLQYNANVAIKDITNRTPLHIAYRNNDVQLAELLLDQTPLSNYTHKAHSIDQKLLNWVYRNQISITKNSQANVKLRKKNSYRYSPY